MSDDQLTMPDEPIYEVEFFGTYHTAEPGKYATFENVKLKFTATMLKDDPLSLFSKVSMEIMPEKYPDFNALRKWHHYPPVRIDGGKPVRQKLELMGRAELLEYAANWRDGDGMQIELGLINSDPELRDAIKRYEEDPDGFLRLQKMQMEKYGDKIRKKKAILELNNAKVGVGVGAGSTAPKPANKGGRGKKTNPEDEY